MGILGRFPPSINLKSVKINDVSEAKSVPCHRVRPHNLVSWLHWVRWVRELTLSVLNGPNTLKCITLSDVESTASHRNVVFSSNFKSTYEGTFPKTLIASGSRITR
jgi:hypothetical protein